MKKYKDGYGREYKKDGKFWKVFRDGEWYVISGEPLFELTKIENFK